MALMTKFHHRKPKHHADHNKKPHLLYFIIPISSIIWLSLLYTRRHTSTLLSSSTSKFSTSKFSKLPECLGRYIYIQNIPAKFNNDILDDCTNLDPWTDLCWTLENSGLGQRLDNSFARVITGRKVFSDFGWYNTHQFSLELIFHNRMKQYECLTNDSAKAAAIFVPFYIGLNIARYLWGYNITFRDAAGIEVLNWLKSTREWQATGGKDHFLVSGRIGWDFRRWTDGEYDWGSKFLLLPEAKNITVLDIEANPWDTNDVAIPYPTYFHPSSEEQLLEWQEELRNFRRPWLFSFAGADRAYMKSSIRGELIDQCKRSKNCNLLRCDKKAVVKCHTPSNIMSMFESSVFCLQPRGDSYTRRSIFDSMLAGCIPVFFHSGSAYLQYVWHLPRNYSKYSVFVSEDEVKVGKVDIEEVLGKYSDAEVKEMREEVIRIIPRLIYADPRSRLENVKDAFDFAVEGMINRAWKHRREMEDDGKSQD